MFCHEVLSDFNCFQESCINTNLNHTNFVVIAFPLVLGTSAINFLVQESQSKVKETVVTNKHACAKSGSDCSATTSLPVLVRQLPYSSHKSETTP